MSYLTGVILLCLAVAVIIGMVIQGVGYARGRQIITRRQFGMRMATGVLLLLTIGLMFYTAIVRLTNPYQALMVWGLLTLMPLAVIILAWLDLRQVARTRHQRQAELYRHLADIEQELRNRPRQ